MNLTSIEQQYLSEQQKDKLVELANKQVYSDKKYNRDTVLVERTQIEDRTPDRGSKSVAETWQLIGDDDRLTMTDKLMTGMKIAGYTQKEISKLIGKSQQTVQQQYRQIRDKLKSNSVIAGVS